MSMSAFGTILSNAGATSMGRPAAAPRPVVAAVTFRWARFLARLRTVPPFFGAVAETVALPAAATAGGAGRRPAGRGMFRTAAAAAEASARQAQAHAEVRPLLTVLRLLPAALSHVQSRR